MLKENWLEGIVKRHYDVVTDPEIIKNCDGMQQYNGQWWMPLEGCDTLSNLLFDIIVESAESPYCEECGSCGETGCCPPTKCKEVKCKYGEVNLKDYETLQKQWDVMFSCLSILSMYPFDIEEAKTALKEVDKLWEKMYNKE